jgi:hypothetical protein
MDIFMIIDLHSMMWMMNIMRLCSSAIMLSLQNCSSLASAGAKYCTRKHCAIWVMKNLLIFSDFHSAIKLRSKAVGHEIV